MKQILIIGSTCVDVLINLDHFPCSEEDISILHQSLRVGGCAYNVSDMIRHFGVSYTLCSPVGTGIYGLFVESAFSEKKIPVFARIPNKENGCCYCLVDKNGERSFISYHGAEYLFKKEWFNTIDRDSFDSLFLCGLELEEETAEDLVSFVESEKKKFTDSGKNLTVYFAPGPRINNISPDLMTRVLATSCIIHFSQKEALAYTGCLTVSDAAHKLNSITHNSLIITLGKDGAYCLDGKTLEESFIPSYSSIVKDTIGAGDAHLGAVIAGLSLNLPISEAVKYANKAASAIVSVSGSTITDEEFAKLNFPNIHNSFGITNV